jgi:hypothetical protein
MQQIDYTLWHEHKYEVYQTELLFNRNFPYRKFMIREKMETDRIIDSFESTVTSGHERKYNNLINKCARLNYDFQLYTQELMLYCNNGSN